MKYASKKIIFFGYFFSIFAFCLISMPQAHADADAVDDAYNELKQLIFGHLRETTAPVYFYNWHEASTNAQLSEHAKDPSALASLQAQAKSYWDRQLNPPDPMRERLPGLYFAQDPVVSRSLGGSDQRWVLTRLRLPPGSRILDAQHPFSLLGDKQGWITLLACPESWKDDSNLMVKLVDPRECRAFPKCAATLRKLFKDDLKIDAFKYNWSSTKFENMPNSESTAIVVMGTDKIDSDSVSILNHLTLDSESDRIRIQSMFYKAAKDSDEIENVPEKLSKSVLADRFLWGDLEGKNFDNSLNEWMQKNLYNERILASKNIGGSCEEYFKLIAVPH